MSPESDTLSRYMSKDAACSYENPDRIGMFSANARSLYCTPPSSGHDSYYCSIVGVYSSSIKVAHLQKRRSTCFMSSAAART